MVDFTEGQILTTDKKGRRRVEVENRTIFEKVEDEGGMFSHKKIRIAEKGPVLTGDKRERRRKYIDDTITWQNLAQTLGCECCGRALQQKTFRALFSREGDTATLCEVCQRNLEKDIEVTERRDSVVFREQQRVETSSTVWAMLCKI